MATRNGWKDPKIIFMASTTDHQTLSTERVISVEASAAAVVRDALAAENDPSAMALWIEVAGVDAGRYRYDLYLQALSDAQSGDAVDSQEEIAIVIPEASKAKLVGAVLQWSEDNGGGLVLVNPNGPEAAEVAPGVPEEVLAAGLDFELALRAIKVIEDQVNPSIASHGGRSDLVALDAATGRAYVRLSGGCQGCAMSRMTLSQGISKILLEEISELTDVVDVTDHAVGENPFYS